MRLLWSTGLFLILAAGGIAQQDGRRRAGEEPTPPSHGVVHGIADPVWVRSFEDLCDRSAAIVDGVVETDASRMMPGRGVRIETDFWIAVDHVMKGAVDTSKIVVSEMGGTFGDLHLIMNFPLLKRGDRYVLFLYAEKRPDVPPVPGLPRYEANIFYGTFKVDAGKIQPFFRDPFEGKYTGLTPDAFAAEISAEMAKPAR